MLDDSFVLCHKAFIVNVHHIQSFDTDSRVIQLDNGDECPYSVRSDNELREKIKGMMN